MGVLCKLNAPVGMLCPYTALLYSAESMSVNMTALPLQNATMYEPVGCRVEIQVAPRPDSMPLLYLNAST